MTYALFALPLPVGTEDAVIALILESFSARRLALVKSPLGNHTLERIRQLEDSFDSSNVRYAVPSDNHTGNPS